MIFSDKYAAVRRNVYREQAGSEFISESKRLINSARRMIAREARWRVLRSVLEPAFDTTADLTTGTVSVTNASPTVTFSGVSLITQGIQPGQRFEVTQSGGSSKVFQIESVDSETQVTLTDDYDGTTASGSTYKIFGRERYTLPIYLSEIGFVWHEDRGTPTVLKQIDERAFFYNEFDRNTSDTPDYYYLIDPFGVERQPSAASALSIVSSSNASGDTSAAGVTVTVFGLVSGVPDQESMTLNGTTRVDGTKSFTFIHRVVKNKSTTGRVTLSDQLPSAGSGSTLATLPQSLTHAEPLYERIGLNPMPSTVIPINIWGYRAPYTLVGDNDISELGLDFDELEIQLASALGCWAERQMAEGDKFFEVYRYNLNKLRARNTDRLDDLPVFLKRGDSLYGRQRSALLHPRLAYSKLGGYYGQML